MARFRKGPDKNWEGRWWTLAPCLVVLAEQIETKWPNREEGDGTVASENHDKISPTSDHRPSPYEAQSGATVRAIDSGETSEAITQGLVDALVASRDSRIMYLIYEGRSCWSIPRNGKPAWTWQKYNGVNPHDGHFHLSTKRTTAADNDTRLWKIEAEGDEEMTPEERKWFEDEFKALNTKVDQIDVEVWRHGYEEDPVTKAIIEPSMKQYVLRTKADTSVIRQEVLKSMSLAQLQVMADVVADEIADRVKD